MNTRDARDETAEAIARLRERMESPRALIIDATARESLGMALKRVEEQLQGEPEPVLTIALVGCTGCGKSTLLNALAGAELAQVSDLRPCTKKAMVYHHRDFPQTALSASLANEVAAVVHDRPELRQKQLVDTPDLDSFKTEHRAATQALLKTAGLVLYVFSPERYLEERSWSVIRAEQRFSACVAVLNQVDKATPEVIAQIAGEIRRRFAEIGCPDVRFFQTCARRHTAAGAPQPKPGEPDELAELQRYIEKELTESDVARLLQRQQAAALENLSAEIERVAPSDLGQRLERLSDRAEAESPLLAEELGQEVGARMELMEADMKPFITMRQHQRFSGPLRLWLSVSDFLLYGLPMMVRRIRLGSTAELSNGVEATLFADKVQRVDDLLCRKLYVMQDACTKERLPIEPWRALRTRASGSEFLGALARQVAAQFEATAAVTSRLLRFIVWTASALGLLIPLGLMSGASYMLMRDMTQSRFDGALRLLEWVAVLTVLCCALLHGLLSVVLPAGSSAQRGVGRSLLQGLSVRTMAGWVDSYRMDVESDAAALQEPLAVLRTASQRRLQATAPPRHLSPRPPIPAPSALAATLASPPATAAPEPSPAPNTASHPKRSADLLRLEVQRLGDAPRKDRSS